LLKYSLLVASTAAWSACVWVWER